MPANGYRVLMKEDGNVRRCAVKYDTLVTFSSLSQNIWQKQLKGPKTYFGPQFQFIMAGKAELAVLGVLVEIPHFMVDQEVNGRK